MRAAPLLRLSLLPLLALSSLTACAAPTDGSAAVPASPTSGGAAGAASCAKDALHTVKTATLTLGTDTPAYPPWFQDDAPANGKGYESAVGYAIADKLGFTKDQVSWVVVPFNTAIAPGAKTFDLDLNQISISDERKKAVDFSSGYYNVRQAVVTYRGSPIAGAKSMAELASAKLGAQVGTTSYTAITDQIKPSATPNVFDTNDLAVQALKNKQIDGIVVDLPTAFYLTSAQLDDGDIVGQLPQSGRPEQFGAVLDKGSALTSCVSKAVEALRAEGTLAELEKTWLTGQGAPELS